MAKSMLDIQLLQVHPALGHTLGCMSVVEVHTSNEAKYMFQMKRVAKLVFYAKLNSTHITPVPTHETFTVLGHFRDITGTWRAGFALCTGPPPSGTRNTNIHL